MPGLNNIPLSDSRPGVTVLAREGFGRNEDRMALAECLLG